MTSKLITIRLEQSLLNDLEQICEWEQADRTSIIRKLLKKGISIAKLNNAMRLYQEEKISIGKAAELAGISLWEFHDELIRLKITHHLDEEDLMQDLKTIQKLQNK